MHFSPSLLFAEISLLKIPIARLTNQKLPYTLHRLKIAHHNSLIKINRSTVNRLKLPKTIRHIKLTKT